MRIVNRKNHTPKLLSLKYIVVVLHMRELLELSHDSLIWTSKRRKESCQGSQIKENISFFRAMVNVCSIFQSSKPLHWV